MEGKLVGNIADGEAVGSCVAIQLPELANKASLLA